MSKELFSERLAELRKHSELTQETLGKLLSVSAHTISQWEQGKSFPKHRCTTYKMIMDIFQVPADYLFGSQDIAPADIPNRHNDLEFMSHYTGLDPYTQKLFNQLVIVYYEFRHAHKSEKVDD
jgi:transcriptional regulator with XRE-family HTH domain